METLFILKSSPYNDNYSLILDLVLPSDSIVLIQDATIAARSAPLEFQKKIEDLSQKGIKTYVLKEDLEIRNIEEINSLYEKIDYKGLVKLITEHKRVAA